VSKKKQINLSSSKQSKMMNQSNLSLNNMSHLGGPTSHHATFHHGQNQSNYGLQSSSQSAYNRQSFTNQDFLAQQQTANYAAYS
jgi:hypothetical protein